MKRCIMDASIQYGLGLLIIKINSSLKDNREDHK